MASEDAGNQENWSSAVQDLLRLAEEKVRATQRPVPMAAIVPSLMVFVAL